MPTPAEQFQPGQRINEPTFREDLNRVVDLGNDIMAHDYDMPVGTPWGDGGAGRDWFWAQLSGLPVCITMGTVSTDINIAFDGTAAQPGSSGFGVSNEASGFTFTFGWKQVTWTKETYDGTTYHRPEVQEVDGGLNSTENGRARNIAEIKHKAAEGGNDDELPWIIYGVNISGTYYPADMFPIPPGTWFSIVTGDRGWKALSDTANQTMPVVKMRAMQNAGETVVTYWFEDAGGHDGGCAPVSPE